LGSGLFYSHIKPSEISSEDQETFDIVGNIYLWAGEKINENIEINFLGYYQPVLSDTKNYRLNQNLQVLNKITNHLKFSLELSYNFNSSPYVNTDSSDFTTKIGLKYKF